ncbi:MAG TPA: MFS transporter [Geminicoccaceae bacterium]|nr:MFS transporter [Geminicoccaceae bacterium]
MAIEYTQPRSIERPYGWVVAFASMAMMAVGAGATYLVVVALKPIAAEFGWPRAVPSLCYSLALLGAGLGGLFWGKVSDRVGMVRPALLGGCMVALGAWLASSADGVFTLYIAHGLFIGFLGNGVFVAPLLANITRWFDRRVGMAVAVVATGQSMAGAVWPPILRYLTDAYGWRQAFSTYAAIALLMLLPLGLALRAPPRSTTGSSRIGGDGSGRVLGWPANMVIGVLCLAIVGCCVAMSMPMVHIIAYATDLGHPGARAAEMLAVLLAAAVVSRLVAGWVADRIGGLWTLLIGSTGQVLMLIGFTLVQSLIGLYLVAALFGLVYGGIVPCYAIIVRELFPLGQVGWRIGIVFLFGTIGMALGGWLGGQIFDLTGSYHSAFLVGVVFNLGNLALVAALLLRQGWTVPRHAAA